MIRSLASTLSPPNVDRREPTTPVLGPRTLLLRRLTDIFIVCGATYAVVFSLVLQQWVAAWVLILATPAGMLTQAVEKWSRSPATAANYLITLIFAAVSSLVLVTGGLASPSLMWLIVIPMSAVILNGPRWGLAWLPVVVLEVILIGWLDVAGLLLPSRISPNGMNLLATLSVIGLAVSVFACVHIYHLHVSHVNRLLHDQASHDGLTGLYNYRAMVALLEQFTSSSPDAPQFCSLIMIDIDSFKSINDRFGHATGDLMLKEAARRIRGCVRNTDYVGRFGGEEFLCVLPTCPQSIAAKIAENVRHAFEVHNEVNSIVTVHAEPKMTISLGVACYDSSRAADIFAVLSRADVALYEAKQTGKNRVCLADFREREANGLR